MEGPPGQADWAPCCLSGVHLGSGRDPGPRPGPRELALPSQKPPGHGFCLCSWVLSGVCGLAFPTFLSGKVLERTCRQMVTFWQALFGQRGLPQGHLSQQSHRQTDKGEGQEGSQALTLRVSLSWGWEASRYYIHIHTLKHEVGSSGGLGQGQGAALGA